MRVVESADLPATSRRAGRGSLNPFLDPLAVAVIGASADPSKVGGSVLANLRAGGFTGRIVPVNRARAVVQGLPAVASLREAPDKVELAVIAVPAAHVLGALEDCVACGVSGAIVISAGFRESGPDGARREHELREWLAAQPLRVVGPNCLGWIRPARRLNVTFAPGMPRRGAIGFVSHSGALATAILDWSRDHGIGFSLLASLGNQADVTETELFTALADDPETRVILGYLEGVADGRAFFEALGAAAARKPCVLMKAGRSAEGARAVASHTGALAGSDVAFDAAVRQAGAVRVDTLEEMFDVARLLIAGRAPSGRRVVFLTNGGGLGILATDAARAVGLDVSPLSKSGRTQLRAIVPPQAAVANPVDLVGDATAARYGAAVEALRGELASLVVMLAPQAATDAVAVARSVLAATRDWPASVLAVFVGGARVRPGVTALEEGGVPCYAFPERAVGALARSVRIAERAPTPVIRERGTTDSSTRRDAAWARVRAAGRLVVPAAAALLEAYGIPIQPMSLAKTAAAAAAAAAHFEGPVALKIVSPDIVHKTDVGGVRLGVDGSDAVRAAAAGMLARVRRSAPEARIEGILVQPMAPEGDVELLLGSVRDRQFGPLVTVGFGGIYVEILRDTATRLAPVTAETARTMLGELRLAPALAGARGRPPVDLDALADTIARFSWITVELPEIAEIELNPLRAGAGGAVALDIRGRLELRA